MRSISLAEAGSSFSNDERPLVILSAPNYESRSVTGLKELLEVLSRNLNASRDRLGIITLESQRGRVQPLEYLKRINIEEIVTYIGRDPIMQTLLQRITLLYPLQSQLDGAFERLTETLDKPFALVLDITAMPRALVYAFLDLAIQKFQAGTFSNIYIVYHWADGYPRMRYAAEVGELRSVRTAEPLGSLLQNRARVYAALFIGRQGFDARQFLEALPATKEATVYHFINRDRPLHSIEILRTNASILTDDSVQLRSYLSIDSGHQKLLSWARAEATRDQAVHLIA
jgi:hypothetical protein